MAMYGDELHEKLEHAFYQNDFGKPYPDCLTVHTSAFWVDGANISASKIKNAYKVTMNDRTQVYCISVDDALIKDKKGISLAKCDEILFSKTAFVYVEAKMRMKNGTNPEKEIKDALQNKIPNTHDIIRGKLADDGQSLSEKNIGIVIAMNDTAIPRIKQQREAKYTLDAQKSVGKFVRYVSIQPTLHFDE